MALGEIAAAPEEVDEEEADVSGGGATRTVPVSSKVRCALAPTMRHVS